MNQIVAFKCEYCRKIYDNRKQAKAHEKKCYFNPQTKSCASCQSLHLIEAPSPELNGVFIPVQKCSKGFDVSKRQLKTNCEKHTVSELDEEFTRNHLKRCRSCFLHWGKREGCGVGIDISENLKTGCAEYVDTDKVLEEFQLTGKTPEYLMDLGIHIK
jgi:hypothetical protein